MCCLTAQPQVRKQMINLKVVNHWSKGPNCEEIRNKIIKKQKETLSKMSQEERSLKMGRWKGKTAENSAHWKGGRCLKDGYVFILKKEHPFCNQRGYMREHRLVMEEYIGRYLEKKEIVHHKNGIKNDNRIENLELLNSQSDHCKDYKMPHLKQYFFKKGMTPWNKGLKK